MTSRPGTVESARSLERQQDLHLALKSLERKRTESLDEVAGRVLASLGAKTRRNRQLTAATILPKKA